VLPDDVITEIKDTAYDVYQSTKPWVCNDNFFLTYNSFESIQFLLKHNKIDFHTRNFRLDSFSGLLIIDNLGSTIAVNENHIPSRQLFTTAHELGHFYLHRELQQEFFEQGLRENVYTQSELIKEKQANLFASELLVPIEVLEKMLQKRFSFYRIARTIGVSKEALKWRIVRYLQDKYNLFYTFAVKLVSEYIDKSTNQRSYEALIFEVNNNASILREIFEALCGRDSFIDNYRFQPRTGILL
jgi:Zn-dependent peptidase ImmA (M78 family)